MGRKGRESVAYVCATWCFPYSKLSWGSLVTGKKQGLFRLELFGYCPLLFGGYRPGTVVGGQLRLCIIPAASYCHVPMVQEGPLLLPCGPCRLPEPLLFAQQTLVKTKSLCPRSRFIPCFTRSQLQCREIKYVPFNEAALIAKSVPLVFVVTRVYYIESLLYYFSKTRMARTAGRSKQGQEDVRRSMNEAVQVVHTCRSVNDAFNRTRP